MVVMQVFYEHHTNTNLFATLLALKAAATSVEIGSLLGAFLFIFLSSFLLRKI